MAPECWFCGKPIRRNERAESLRGSIAVHARCVQQDLTRGERSEHDIVARAA